MQPKVHDIIDRLAAEHNLPVYVIEEIVAYQFKFLRDKIRSKENKVIMLPGWGKYIPSMTKLAHIERHNARNASSSESDALQRTS